MLHKGAFFQAITARAIFKRDFIHNVILHLLKKKSYNIILQNYVKTYHLKKNSTMTHIISMS